MLSSDHKITFEHSQNVFEILYSLHMDALRVYMRMWGVRYSCSDGKTNTNHHIFLAADQVHICSIFLELIDKNQNGKDYQKVTKDEHPSWHD